MRALRLHAPCTPLIADEVAIPSPGPGEVLLEVCACGVCRTDLHIVDGELLAPRLPLVPGHEIVGRVARRGPGAERFAEGERVGVPWLGGACGTCGYCRSGRENLCDRASFTGLHRDGGYARFALADERFCFALPDAFDDAHAAPLLCAGLIGHRAYSMAPDARRLGIYGFGAAALIFAPVGALVPAALAAIAKGGVVVCAGIHMSDIPAFPYALLWGERVVRSVANLTRRDGESFLRVAAQARVRTEVAPYALGRANEALDDLRHGRFEGAAVLLPET